MLEEVEFRLKGMVWLLAMAVKAGRKMAADAVRILEARGRQGLAHRER